MFPIYRSPYVTQRCFPVPKLILPSPCVPQYPCLPNPYAPQSLCSPVNLFPSPYRCSLVPMFPSPYVPPTSSPVPMFPSPIPQTCLPFLIFPTHDSQSLCSAVPMFPKYVPQSSPYSPPLVHQSLCSPVLFHRNIFHSFCPPNMFPSPYVPPTRSTVSVFPSPYFPWHSPIPYDRSLYNPQKCFQSYVPQRCYLVPILHSLVPMLCSFFASQSLCSPITSQVDHQK